MVPITVQLQRSKGILDDGVTLSIIIVALRIDITDLLSPKDTPLN